MATRSVTSMPKPSMPGMRRSELDIRRIRLQPRSASTCAPRPKSRRASLDAGASLLGLASGWTSLGVTPGSRYYANFAQPNHFALFLVMAVVCVSWLYLTQRIGEICAGLAIAVFGLGIAMSVSRAAYLDLGAVALWLSLF